MLANEVYFVFWMCCVLLNAVSSFTFQRPCYFDDCIVFPESEEIVNSQNKVEEINSQNKVEETIAPRPSESKQKQVYCGMHRSKSMHSRIYGGETPTLGEFPWMALLGYGFTDNVKFMCAGALIGPRHVLTAGHCVTGPSLVDVGPLRVVRFGEYNMKTNPDCVKKKCALPYQQIKVVNRYPHPYYKSHRKEYDIALVQLEKEVMMTDYIQPICLPSSTYPEIKYGKYYSIAGWGKTQSATNSDVMLKTEVPLLPNTSCAKAYTMLNFTDLYEGQLCAGGEEGVDSCRGDSGGPLMAKSDYSSDDLGPWYVIGVVSYGVTPCGLKGKPAVYTNVSFYIDWINNVLSNHKNNL